MVTGNNTVAAASMHGSSSSFRFLPFRCCSSSSSAGYLGISDKRLDEEEEENMAIQVFPDSPIMGMSPRISVSQDASQSEGDIPVASSVEAVDFNFCAFREILDYEASSADELFSDGKILPVEIKKRIPNLRSVEEPSQQPLVPAPPPPPRKSAKSLETEEKHKSSSSSFWGFRRSSSLNCGGGHGGTLCPLPLLSRSYSAGSIASGKRAQKQQQQNILKHQKQQQHSSIGGYYSRKALKKNNPAGGVYGVKFSPVLNVPPANLFGLGSIFSGRTKKKTNY